MAVYTRVNSKDINYIEKNYNIGKIKSFTGIKKGIENTNYLLKTKNKNLYWHFLKKEFKKKNYLSLWI